MPLLRAAVVSLAAIGVGALLNLALALVVGRSYGAAQTGVFFAAIGMFLVLGNGLKLGADTGAVRFVSRLRALDASGDVKATLLVAFAPVAAVSSALGGVLWAAAPHLMGGSEVTALTRVLAPFVPLFALLCVASAALRGRGGVGAYVLLQNVLLPLTRLLGVIATALAGITILGATAAWAFGLPALVLLGGSLLWRATRDLPGGWYTPASGRTLADLASEFWSFALPRAGSAVVEMALEWLDVVLVALLAGPEVAGLYAVATRLVKIPLLAEHAARIALATPISAGLARGEVAAVGRLLRTATAAMVTLVWPYLLLLALFGGPVMSWFGEGFAVGAPLLGVLALGMGARAAAGPVQSVLLLGGLSRAQLVNKLAALAVCVGGNLLLTPRWGALGAAAAWTLATCVDTALASWQVRRRMGIPYWSAGTRAHEAGALEPSDAKPALSLRAHSALPTPVAGECP